MSVDDVVAGQGAPAFGWRTTLAVVLGGSLLFVALLWMVGAGLTGGDTNDGGGHVGGHGLNGYAGFAQYLEARGIRVSRSRSVSALRDPGVLVLTPPPLAEGKDIARIVAARRYIGPTIVIAPKWVAVPTGADPRDAQAGARKGWVRLVQVATPEWRGFLDEVTVAVRPARGGWRGAGLGGPLVEPRQVESASGNDLVPLATTTNGRLLAGYIADRGYYPALAALAEVSDKVAGAARKDADEDSDDEDTDDQDTALYPLVIVAEPDLVDNYGLRASVNARLGERLIRAAGENGKGVVFDMTLNGFARSPNLLTLAFTPPFLAATLCLLFAAIAAGWRAFVRFGPPVEEDRAIAFGKRALVANAAGLIVRSGRLHLLTAPYAAASRDRLARALGLPRGVGSGETDAAIDRTLARRAPGSSGDTQPFTILVARLLATRRRPDMLAAAEALHTLERTLTR